MKIAITSSGNSPDSVMDSRFGRCVYFVFYDTKTGTMEFVPNPNKDAIEGAGPASVQLVASKGVDKVVSGEFGNKVKALFDSLKVQLIIPETPNLTINQIIEKFAKQQK